MNIYYYSYITDTVVGSNVSLFLLSIIFPIGNILIALPLAPGGLGVGHLAFDSLFQLIGIKDGANIFNLVFVINMSLNLLGAIPYFLMKKDLPQTKDLDLVGN